MRSAETYRGARRNERKDLTSITRWKPRFIGAKAPPNMMYAPALNKGKTYKPNGEREVARRNRNISIAAWWHVVGVLKSAA
jgi:hypothetical protein